MLFEVKSDRKKERGSWKIYEPILQKESELKTKTKTLPIQNKTKINIF